MAAEAAEPSSEMRDADISLRAYGLACDQPNPRWTVVRERWKELDAAEVPMVERVAEVLALIEAMGGRAELAKHVLEHERTA